MKKTNIVRSLTLFMAILGLHLAESAFATVFSVGGRSGPWLYSSGLNSSFHYGVNDQLPPTVISGLSFGQTITLSYQSGGVSAGSGFPFRDASGDLSFPNPDALIPNNFNGVFPSSFMSLSNSIFAYELVATFADSSGQIINSPFPIGSGSVAFMVPFGASQLQLGVNDNLFGDNSGSWSVNAAIVPEPSVGSLFAISMLGLTLMRRAKW